MIDRLITVNIEKLALKNNKSVLLLGPRQVGKSTLLKMLRPDLIINLSDEEEFFNHSTKIDLLSSVINKKIHKLILIDEIQRIPSLLNTVQYLIDESKNTKNPFLFLLSGSSARKLKRGQANLLPGRLLAYNLYGLCAKELDYNVNIRRSLQFGFLPEVYFEKNETLCLKLLQAYASTYLKEEIHAEALTRNIQGFARFLNEVATQAGKIIDYSKVSKKAKVSRTSSIRFTEILEDTLIAQRVESYTQIEDLEVVKHAKIYFFDVGVLNGLLGNFVASGDRMGILMEHLVYNQLKNSAASLDIPIEIYYFRTRTGIEVDFLVKLRGNFWAIEVKSGEVQNSDLDGINFLKQHLKLKGSFVVSPKEKKRILDKITICDPIEMLKDMNL